MLNRITAVQLCDARDDDSSNAAGKQNKNSPKKHRPQLLILNY